MSKRDEMFELFIEEVGEPSFTEAVPESAFRQYENVLPKQLITYWREEGWSAYANGMFWIVNPAEYNDSVTLWLQDTQYPNIDSYHVIARTAFGDLFLWGEKNNQFFTISLAYNYIFSDSRKLGTFDEAPDRSIRSFFASHELEEFDLDDMNEQPLFDQAFEKLGHLKPNEVYGFAPMLCAGGEPRVENLAKEDIFIHLAIIKDLSEPMINDVNIASIIESVE